MKKLLSLLARLVVGAFHAFVQSRLSAELSEPERALICKPASDIEPQPIEPSARPVPPAPIPQIQLTKFAHVEMPVVGVF